MSHEFDDGSAKNSLIFFFIIARAMSVHFCNYYGGEEFAKHLTIKNRALKRTNMNISNKDLGTK